MIPIARPQLGPEEEAAVLEVMRSGALAQGERVREFEEAFAGAMGARFETNRNAVGRDQSSTALRTMGEVPIWSATRARVSRIWRGNGMSTGQTVWHAPHDTQVESRKPASRPAVTFA